MPTIRRCCIVGCMSNSRQNPQLQFFQFPRPENPFHKLWKQACHASMSRILPFKKPVVCALHFSPNCIGGRRLTASAVPSLRLEVPSNLKAVEQQAMVEEIERSRKCAYINAVVYEWLVRANLNPQLRGSITHGMIKEKAQTAQQIIGSTSFAADNRWLNRFRETHLSGFAAKLANNQLKPLGPSLWIPDIVQDLQHLFPPTSAERVAKLESMPEEYIDYMQQYGEYDEDDDDSKEQSYEQQQQTTYQRQQQHSMSPYDAYGQHNSFNNYDDFKYYERQQQHMQNNYPSPQSQRQSLNSPPQPQSQQQSPNHRASPNDTPSAKRSKLEEDDGDVKITSNGSEQMEDLTDSPDASESKSKMNGTCTPIHRPTPTPTPNGQASPAASPKVTTNGQTNGHVTLKQTATTDKELETYAQALEYLKPLEDFALFKENFRAIGLISQLEVILRKGDRPITAEPQT